MSQAPRQTVTRTVMPHLLAVLTGTLWLLAVDHARAATEAAAAKEEIQMGVSVDVVPVTSEFSGRQITVFGTIENADGVAQALNQYSIVVTIAGQLQDIVVRRKERVLGIWMNRESRTYKGVPTFYALASNRALKAIADPATLRADRIGIENLSFNLLSTGSQTFTQPAPDFANSLRRLRREKSLFSEDTTGVVFLGSSLFRATLTVPSNIPIGKQTVTAYLFRDGKLLSERSTTFQVERAGFERFMFTLAHVYGLWYGVIAVLLALATGWLASVVFGRS